MRSSAALAAILLLTGLAPGTVWAREMVSVDVRTGAELWRVEAPGGSGALKLCDGVVRPATA